MFHDDRDQALLSRLVGCWSGTVLHRAAANQPLVRMQGTSENRWVLGGRFVEMTLRAGVPGDGCSAVFYIGYERSERCCLLMAAGPANRLATTRRGLWVRESDRLLIVSGEAKAICDVMTPGQLKLELAERRPSGQDFVWFKGEYQQVIAGAIAQSPPRRLPRFVIA